MFILHVTNQVKGGSDQLHFKKSTSLYCKFAFCVKRQNIAGLCQQTFISVQLIDFLDNVLLLAELAQKFNLL
jgi:hypothetical protein